jgi:outer membrane biosynthesis protein TonB
MFNRSYMRMAVTSVMLVLAGFCVDARAQAEGGAIVAIDAPAGYGSAGGSVSQGGSGPSAARPKTTGGSSSTRKATPKTVTTAKAVTRPNPGKWNGAVIGDKYTFLNFEVISAIKPYYTREAKAGRAKGLVQVEVLISTDGTVLSARARTGNPLLHPEAERAALESKFNRPTINGQPARATGFLVYRFGPADADD